jgi:hypothetical protein
VTWVSDHSNRSGWSGASKKRVPGLLTALSIASVGLSSGSAMAEPRTAGSVLDRHDPPNASEALRAKTDDREREPTMGEEARLEAARRMARRAMDLMREHRWVDAQRLLSASYELVGAPTLAVLEGDALVAMGRLNDAVRRFEVARQARLTAGSPRAYRVAVALATERLRVMERKRPRLTVSLQHAHTRPAFLQLWVNGEPLSPEMLGIERHMDPGEYTVVAEFLGQTVSKNVTLQEGARQRIVLEVDSSRLRPDGSDESASESGIHAGRRTAMWISLGIGATGIAAGTIAAVVASERSEALERKCDDTCAPELADEVEAFEEARTASWIGLGVGAAGIATGVVLYLADRDSSSSATRVRPFATLRTLGVMGRF